MHDFIQGCDSSASMAKVLGKTQYQGKKRKEYGQEEEKHNEGAGLRSGPLVGKRQPHSLWVKFSGNTPLVAFSLFCFQSSCFIPMSQPSS